MNVTYCQIKLVVCNPVNLMGNWSRGLKFQMENGTFKSQSYRQEKCSNVYICKKTSSILCSRYISQTRTLEHSLRNRTPILYIVPIPRHTSPIWRIRDTSSPSSCFLKCSLSFNIQASSGPSPSGLAPSQENEWANIKVTYINFLRAIMPTCARAKAVQLG